MTNRDNSSLPLAKALDETIAIRRTPDLYGYAAQAALKELQDSWADMERHGHHSRAEIRAAIKDDIERLRKELTFLSMHVLSAFDAEEII